MLERESVSKERIEKDQVYIHCKVKHFGYPGEEVLMIVASPFMKKPIIEWIPRENVELLPQRLPTKSSEPLEALVPVRKWGEEGEKLFVEITGTAIIVAPKEIIITRSSSVDTLEPRP